MATGALESAAPGDGKTAWCAAQDGTATGCEATVVDPVILVGLIFSFTKPNDKLLEIIFFLTWHILYQVAKSQDLPS